MSKQPEQTEAPSRVVGYDHGEHVLCADHSDPGRPMRADDPRAQEPCLWCNTAPASR